MRHPSDIRKAGDWKRFFYLGPPSNLSAMTDAAKDHVDASVGTALQHVAAQIVADVTYE